MTNYNTSSVTEYAAGASGNVAPIATISGSAADINEPSGVAVARPPRGSGRTPPTGGIFSYEPGAASTARLVACR